MSTEFKVGGLERELTMRIFNRKKDDKIDKSKRDFMKNAGIAAIGTAIGLNAIPDTAFASQNPKEILKRLKETKYSSKDLAHLKNPYNDKWNQLPPGYSHNRDRILALVYGDLIDNLWNLNGNTLQRLKSSSIQLEGFDRQQIMWQTPFLEPAYFFLEEKLSKSNNHIPDETLREVNPALEFFRIGLHDYFTHWHRRHLQVGRWATSENIEKEFLESIFAAAYMREDLAIKHTQEYLDLESIQEKTKKLDETMKIFEKIIPKKPITKEIIMDSADPEDGYNRCLVAAWSSYMLTRNAEIYNDNIGFRDETKENIKTTSGLYAWNLELDFIKKIGIRIRGPPNYDV